MKYILIIGSGVRETAIAKRLLSDSKENINLIAISDKFNPQIVDYCEKTFKVNNLKFNTFLELTFLTKE